MPTMTAALQKICDHHKFNVTGLRPNEVHAIAYEALETSKGTFHAHAIATQLAQAAEALRGEEFAQLRGHLMDGSQAILDMIDVADRASQSREEIAAKLKIESVTSIILEITPGLDGSGHEVHAKTADDVVKLLTSMDEKIEALEEQVTRMRAQAASSVGHETSGQDSEPDAWLYRSKNYDHRGRPTDWGPWALCKAREARQMQALDGFEVRSFFAKPSQPPIWDDNATQFPRLLAEIMATQDTLDMPALANSMDLTVDEVSELFDRANDAWEQAKKRTADTSAARSPRP